VNPPEDGPQKGAASDQPTEAVPAMVAPSRQRGPTERIDLPEIVPATGASSEAEEGEGPPTMATQVVATDPQPEATIPVVGPVAGVSAAGASRVVSRRPRVRRVTRVVRHVDPWSVFKVAALLHFAAYLVALTSGVLLWRVADRTGTLDNVERWFTQFGWESFELQGGEIFHNAWIAGLFLVVALTGVAVLLATLFNLISDLVGGVRVSVLEEEVVATGPTHTRIRRSVQRGGSGNSEGGQSG